MVEDFSSGSLQYLWQDSERASHTFSYLMVVPSLRFDRNTEQKPDINSEAGLTLNMWIAGPVM